MDERASAYLFLLRASVAAAAPVERERERERDAEEREGLANITDIAIGTNWCLLPSYGSRYLALTLVSLVRDSWYFIGAAYKILGFGKSLPRCSYTV